MKWLLAAGIVLSVAGAYLLGYAAGGFAAQMSIDRQANQRCAAAIAEAVESANRAHRSDLELQDAKLAFADAEIARLRDDNAHNARYYERALQSARWEAAQCGS